MSSWRARAVAYVRVSREDEKPENQEYVINEYCRENGLDCLMFPAEVEIARTTDPFERPIFRQVVDFMEKNGIPMLVVESVDRLTAEPEHWEKLISYFAERGWRIVFVRDADITTAFSAAVNLLDSVKKSADSEVVRQVLEHQKKQLLELMRLYWRIKVAVAKDYVEDVRRKIKRAMQRLKAEGRVYTKPTFIHWLALYRSRKPSLRDLNPEDIAEARDYFFSMYVKPYLEGVPVRRLHREFLRREAPVIEMIKSYRLAKLDAARKEGKKVPKIMTTYSSYGAFYSLVKSLAREPR